MLPTPHPSHKQPRLPENEVSAKLKRSFRKKPSFCTADRGFRRKPSFCKVNRSFQRKPSFCETKFSGSPHTGAAREHIPHCRTIAPPHHPIPYSNPPHPPSSSKGYLKSFSSIENLSKTSICHLVHPISIQSKRLPEKEVFEESRVSAKRSQTNSTAATRC